MIIRIWRGWTTRDDADTYEHLLDHHILPDIIARGIVGLHGIDVLRRDTDEGTGEVEFVTIMNFEDQQAIDEFGGEDPHAAVVPDVAREVLVRFDERSAHYALATRHLAPYEVAVRAAHESADTDQSDEHGTDADAGHA